MNQGLSVLSLRADTIMGGQDFTVGRGGPSGIFHRILKNSSKKLHTGRTETGNMLFAFELRGFVAMI